MEGKRVKDSSTVMAQMMNPQDANPAGNVHGGVIMKLIDTVAIGLSLARIHRGLCNPASQSQSCREILHGSGYPGGD